MKYATTSQQSVMSHTKFFIIGVFENPDALTFPSHVTPIVAAHTDGLWQRWLYTVGVPCSLLLTKPLGFPVRRFSSLFPHPTFLLCPPVEFATNSQALYVSKSRVVVSHNRLYLSMALLSFALLSPHHYLSHSSALLYTLLNIWRPAPA